MTERGQNPYTANTPEWQLWENMTSARLQSLAYARDADRYTKLSQESRERSEKYDAALKTLTEKAKPND